MPEYYRHTQIGYVLIVSLVLAVLAIGVSFIFVPEQVAVSSLNTYLTVAAVLALTIVFFYKLEVVVDADFLTIRFGIGLIWRRWPLRNIVSAKTVVCPWWYGWGVHYTPRGWLYNVSGFEAVQITLASGKSLLVGTDQPKLLQAAVLGRSTIDK